METHLRCFSVYFTSWQRVLNVIFCHWFFFLIKKEKLQSGTEGKSVYVSIRYISEMRMQSVQKGSGTKEKEIKEINARLWVRSNSQNTYKQVMEFPLTDSCVYSVEHGPFRHYRDHTAYRTRGRKGSVQSLYKLTPNIFGQSLQTRTK